MGIGNLINKSNIQTELTGSIDYAPMNIFESVEAGFEYYKYNYNSNAQRLLENNQIQKQENALSDILGQSVVDIIGEDVYNSDQRFSAIDNLIKDYRNKNDERFNDILTTEEMKIAAVEEAQKIGIDYEKRIRGASPLETVAGGIIGSLGASLQDPVTWATLGAGAVVSAATRTTSVLRLIAVEAGIGAASEAALQPFISEWQKTIGNQYGLGDALTNVAFAGLLSGGFSGLASVPFRSAVEGARNKSSILFEIAASSEKTPEYARSVLRQMSDVARVRESNIFNEVTPKTIAAHNNNVRLINEAIEQRRSLDTVELDTTASRLANDVPNKPIKPEKLIDKDEADFNNLDLKKIQRVLDEDSIKKINEIDELEFETFVKENPDVKITYEDGTSVRAADLQKEVVAARKLYDAVKVCTL